MCAHHPLLCILPPHLLKKISQSTDPRLKKTAESAFRSLLLTEQMRGTRNAIGSFAAFTAVPTGEKRRTVYDASKSTQLPGKRVRGEGDAPSKDPAVNEAYDGAGYTYDFYKTQLDRNSIDDRGLRLDSTVHYSRDMDNAFWDGKQMVYGDGDRVLFNRFTLSVDVIAHELTHGVTQYEASLAYQDQPGALNESYSDVFGSLVKQFVLKQTADQADWLIGQGLLAKGVKGTALRSLKEPGTAYNDPNLGKDPQPAHMRKYVRTGDDHGGVHINSGIPNRAFYLAATAIGGFAWKKAGKIWYVTLRDRLRELATFSDAAVATADVAAHLYRPGSDVHKAVQDAWKAVGVERRAKRSTAVETKVTTRAAALAARAARPAKRNGVRGGATVGRSINGAKGRIALVARGKKAAGAKKVQ